MSTGIGAGVGEGAGGGVDEDGGGAEDVVPGLGVDGEFVAIVDGCEDEPHAASIIAVPAASMSNPSREVIIRAFQDLFVNAMRCPAAGLALGAQNRELLEGRPFSARRAGRPGLVPLQNDYAFLLRTPSCGCKLGLEGIVAKRSDSIYIPGKESDSWRKHRFNQEDEFVIGGYIPGGQNFSELLTRTYNPIFV